MVTVKFKAKMLKYVHALVAQWIEHLPSKEEMKVRFPPRAQSDQRISEASSSKEVEQVPSKNEMEVRFFPGSQFGIIRRSGGTGRRAGLRSLWTLYVLGGSNPLFCTLRARVAEWYTRTPKERMKQFMQVQVLSRAPRSLSSVG